MDSRSTRLRCGGLMVVIGLLWLAQRIGWLPTGYLGRMILMMIGFWVLMTSRFFKNDADHHGDDLKPKQTVKGEKSGGGKMVSKCETCKMRLHAEKKPGSVLSKIWRWHTTWCPGWKKYQRNVKFARSESKT